MIADKRVSECEDKSIESIYLEERKKRLGKKWTKSQWPLGQYQVVLCNLCSKRNKENWAEKIKNTQNFQKFYENQTYGISKLSNLQAILEKKQQIKMKMKHIVPSQISEK